MAEYYYPNFLPIEMRDNSTWLSVKPKILKDIDNTKSKDKSSAVQSKDDKESLDTYYFLMPNEFSFSVKHDWKEYSNVVGEIRDIESKFRSAGGQLVPVVKGIGDIVGNRKYKNSNDLIKAFIEMGNNIPLYGEFGIAKKNDNPITYENSERKSLTFEFEFSTYMNPKTDVFDPIQKLLWLSSPDSTGDYKPDYTYPYVFEIGSVTNSNRTSLVYIKDSIVKSITAEFRSPYKNGYAMSGSMTIQFEDISPLYSSTAWRPPSLGSNKISVTSLLPTYSNNLENLKDDLRNLENLKNLKGKV